MTGRRQFPEHEAHGATPYMVGTRFPLLHDNRLPCCDDGRRSAPVIFTAATAIV
jgi:hypothetical protein